MDVVFEETKISGCYVIIPQKKSDLRGYFVKTFNSINYKRNSLKFDIKESYYSVSKKNVIRGLHFQLPPKDHIKTVYCVKGKIFDVVVDLRLGSATFGKYLMFELSEEDPKVIYIPKGLAHGFCALSKYAIVIYNTSTVYSPEFDSGILWNSLDIPWPCKDPILSERDKSFVNFKDFHSPFVI